MKISEIENKIKEKNNGFLLSNFETSQPDMGSPIIELMGIAKRTLPNSASLKPKKDLIVGILEAQVEKQNPERKKKMLNAVRCLTLISIVKK
ncbi:hypothetical protein GGR42_000736 [Saonia flava]|uniref:Uncharacterized protein n=1 Tax=Saonia flava TaxID=523696 RepID=A0A846QYR5_9FLAO|nr:hypothetical protein [Saonia flava]